MMTPTRIPHAKSFSNDNFCNQEIVESNRKWACESHLPNGNTAEDRSSARREIRPAVRAPGHREKRGMPVLGLADCKRIEIQKLT
jgi:hypothetical protein